MFFFVLCYFSRTEAVNPMAQVRPSSSLFLLLIFNPEPTKKPLCEGAFSFFLSY